MLQLDSSSGNTNERNPNLARRASEVNKEVSTFRPALGSVYAIHRLMKSITAFKGWKTIAVISVAAAAAISGCAAQMPLAARQDPAPRKAGVEANDPRSNVGSLSVDSSSDPPAMSGDIIEPGDQVQVMVWGYPKFNTTTTVKNYGTIAVPLVGDVIAEGLTEKQLAKEIEERLSEYIKGEARVTISHVSVGKRISVMGAVNKQGNYPALGEVSLVEVIAEAGGAATDADLRHVKIFRQGKSENAAEVDLQSYLENDNIANVPDVHAGDTVFVPEEQNLIRQVARYGQDVLVLFGFFALLH